MKKKNKTARRQFVKLSALGLGSIALGPVISASKKTSGLFVKPDAVSKKLTILCVGAHPGDPEFGCGGTMAKYSAAGHDVIFLYLTRGEAYNDKQSYEVSANLRTKEAEESCKILKAKPLFAGQIDGNTELNKKRNEEMTNLVLSQKPDIVFTHWPLDTHADHQVAGLLTLTAWIKSKKQFQLYFYEVNTGSETMGFTPTDYVDISDVLDTKEAAMFAHKTQNPAEVYNDWFKTMQSFRGLEKGVKAAEGFVHFNPEKTTVSGLADL